MMVSRLSSHDSNLRHPSILNDFVFIFLTAVFLWVPIQFSGSFPIPFQSFGICALAVLLIARYYRSLDEAERRINLLSFAMLLYGLWVAISCGMHYWALKSLAPEATLYASKVTTIKSDEYWAIWTLYHVAQIYIFFLSLFLVSIVIFRSTESGWRKLTWIPLIFIPCLLVALYQFYVDPFFLNNRPLRDWISGLGTDLSAFRNSLFLILPLCVFTIIIAQRWWKKILYVFLAILILWLARLSHGRIVIMGMFLFAAAVPMIGAWVHGFRSDKGRWYLYAGLVWILALVLLAGIAFSKFNSYTSKLLSERVRSTLSYSFKGDFSEVDPFRIEMTRQAWQLIKLSPISGWGPGGFLRNVDKIRFVDGDQFVDGDPFLQYQYGPNLYLDWGADLGLLGAGVTLLLYVMPLWMILRVQKRIHVREERWAVGIIFVTLVIMLLIFNVEPYTHFPEGQWIFVVYLGFLISVALKYGYTFYPIKGWGWGVGALLLTTVFIAGTYSTTFGSKGYDAIQKAVSKPPYKSNHGYYANYLDENWPGVKTQWMNKKTVSTINALSDILHFKVVVPPRKSLGRDILRLKISLNEKILDERYFFKGGEYDLYYYIPGIENKMIEIKTELSQSHNPYRRGDFDFEGIIQPIAFMKAIPEEGIGFYPWEKMGKRRPPGWPQESKTERLRWTGIQATMNISTNLRKVGIIYLTSFHPEPDQYPMVLDILGDDRVIRQEKFNDYGKWRKIYFESRELKDFKTLTFRLNKTWNPLLCGFNDDPRDLGIYMIVPEIE